MDKNLKKLFNLCYDRGDDVEFLKKFCSLAEEYTTWTKFFGKVRVINIKFYGFNGSPYVIHDFKEENEPTIEKGTSFIQWLIEVFEESNDKDYIYDFWFDRLLDILLDEV